PPVPIPVGPHPVPHKELGPASRAAPGADIDDEVFILAHALQKKIVSDLPPPPPVSPPHNPSPNNNKTPSPQPLQPCCTPSGSDFESRMTAKQQLISQMRPEKNHWMRKMTRPSKRKEIQAEELHVQLAKGKKGKGKKTMSKVLSSLDLSLKKQNNVPSPFTIHANFEKQIQDLAAEISKAPQLLFLLVGEAWYGIHREIKKSKHMSPQEWTKLVAAKRNKYCKDNLGNKWEDSKALNTLFEIMVWYLEKHKTYVEDLKLEGTFNKVVGKVQHEYMCLPDHTGRTGSAMWGATPAFEQMKIDEKGVISQQIAEWESLLRRADMALNGDTEKHEKELWTVQIMGNKHDHAQ
ncbi:hypothetical protein DXG01_006947, partial [Tephrocybe rancida]